MVSRRACARSASGLVHHVEGTQWWMASSIVLRVETSGVQAPTRRCACMDMAASVTAVLDVNTVFANVAVEPPPTRTAPPPCGVQ